MNKFIRFTGAVVLASAIALVVFQLARATPTRTPHPIYKRIVVIVDGDHPEAVKKSVRSILAQDVDIDEIVACEIDDALCSAVTTQRDCFDKDVIKAALDRELSRDTGLCVVTAGSTFDAGEIRRALDVVAETSSDFVGDGLLATTVGLQDSLRGR